MLREFRGQNAQVEVFRETLALTVRAELWAIRTIPRTISAALSADAVGVCCCLEEAEAVAQAESSSRTAMTVCCGGVAWYPCWIWRSVGEVA